MLNWKSFFKDVLKHRKKAMVASALLILFSLGGIAYQGGLLYGIDFTGGLQILLEFQDDLSTDEVNQIRNVFRGTLSTSQVNTVGIKGGSSRRGLMVTVRGQKLVNSLTRRLFQAGRAGSKKAFEPVKGSAGNTLLGSDILRANFRLGGESSDDESQKIDITRASRESIRSRVRSIVNTELSNRVLELIRSEFGGKTEGIDLNWASPDEIQNWLARKQNEAFVDRIVSLRTKNSLTTTRMAGLLEEFGVPRETFFEVFRIGGEDPEKLNLQDLPPENVGEVTFDEFFQGRYETIANRIVEERQQKGLFRSKEQLFQMGVFEDLQKERLVKSSTLAPFVMKRREMISPSIGSDLIGMAALAILLSFVGILAYLYVRFELTYSIGAIGAIFHDVLITVGLITVLGIEFNVPVVAAILTVIGYSLNDTIVNFDRVRENRVLMGHDSDWYSVINRSVFEVLNRTIVTSLTTFIAALILYLYGGIALSGFAATLL
ncbi:MAG: protein translocase subunit SecF, partial [bacterium]